MKRRVDRDTEINHANKILFDKIRGVLERPAYKKQVMFDSKTVAAKASLSPTALNRTLKTDQSSIMENSNMRTHICFIFAIFQSTMDE